MFAYISKQINTLPKYDLGNEIYTALE